MRAWLSASGSAALLASLMALLMAPAASAQPSSQPSTPPSLQQSLMGQSLVLRGTLDGQRIQLSLQPKRNEDGLQGRYVVLGDPAEILLAGEVEGDDLVMEESRNGRDVSGQWEGHRQGATIVGTWSNVDGSVTRPFSLQLP